MAKYAKPPQRTAVLNAHSPTNAPPVFGAVLTLKSFGTVLQNVLLSNYKIYNKNYMLYYVCYMSDHPKILHIHRQQRCRRVRKSLGVIVLF